MSQKRKCQPIATASTRQVVLRDNIQVTYQNLGNSIHHIVLFATFPRLQSILNAVDDLLHRSS